MQVHVFVCMGDGSHNARSAVGQKCVHMDISEIHARPVVHLHVHMANGRQSAKSVVGLEYVNMVV